MSARGKNDLLLTARSGLDSAMFRAELIFALGIAFVLMAYRFAS